MNGLGGSPTMKWTALLPLLLNTRCKSPVGSSLIQVLKAPAQAVTNPAETRLHTDESYSSKATAATTSHPQREVCRSCQICLETACQSHRLTTIGRVCLDYLLTLRTPLRLWMLGVQQARFRRQNAVVRGFHRRDGCLKRTARPQRPENESTPV